MASLTLQGSDLVYTSRYDTGLVAALKAAIPDTARRWDKVTKSWIVASQYGPLLAQLTQQYLGEHIAVPSLPAAQTRPEQRLLEVRYIGACKDRGSEVTAYGYAGGSWSVVFPESTLRAWFEQEARPDEGRTLYDVLCLPRTANESAVKRAYRRLALQWHPDTCREANAAETFMAIKHAYDVLSEARLRARYDAGLALEASLKASRQAAQDPYLLAKQVAYRSPLRCGWILTTGREQLGRFVVDKIDMWEDIADAAGRTLVTSWPLGADRFQENWV